jgi:arylsulfatase
VKPFDDEVFLSLVRTFVAAAGDPDIAQELKNGKQLGDRTYKVHLDGYNQTDMITGKGASQRHEIFYLTETTLAALRIDDYKYRFTDQPGGWLGATEKVDWPILVNSGRVGPARSF